MSMLAWAAVFAASALTAPLEEIYNDSPVVTNVTFEGLATTAQVDAEVAAATNAATRAAVSAAKDYADGATNRMATALRGEIAAAKPADYEAVKAKAESALQPAATNGVPEALVSHASLLSSLSSTVAAHEADTSNPHGVTAAQVGAYTTKEADTKMSAASNALARAVAEIDGRMTNHVTRAEVEPEYNEDGTPTGAAARAAYANEAYRSKNTDSAYESVLLCSVFNSYEDENEFRKIKYDNEANAWSVWNRDVSGNRVKGVRSLLQPDGSPFMTSGRLAAQLRGYAPKPAVPFAFDLCLSPDGDDAADGLSPGTAKRTLAGAVAAANATGRTNLVVAVCEGDYEPPYADFGATNAIVFRAVGDKARTRVVGGTNAVCALTSASCAWQGFTFTGFAGKGAEDDGVRICRFGGMTFRDCDFADNDFVTEYGYAAYNECRFYGCAFDRSTYRIVRWDGNSSKGILYRSCVFDGCSVDGVTTKGADAYTNDYDDSLENEWYHILMWDIAATNTIFRLPGSMHANNSYRYKYRNVTIVAPSAWCIPPKTTSYRTPFPTNAAYVTNCLYVIGDAKPGSSAGYILAGTNTVEVPRCVKGVYVALDGSANLTAEGVAADADCPSVRDDGQPDYGWKSSGLGAAKTSLAQAKRYADTKASSVSSSLASHRNSRANPHKVTAAQVGAYTKAETDALLTPTVALTAEQESRGVTYVKNGLDQNCAIAIGTNAVASVDPAYVANAPSNAILRSVSVAIGGNADARGDGTGMSQGIAIGWWSQAKAGNAIAIGSGAQHTNETAMSGNATVASAACAVAVGYSAKATATSAVQIGFGTNATPHSLQFEGVPIVRDGRLVAAGVETNDVMRVVEEMLGPRTYADVPDVIEVRSHALTVIAPTNGPLDEVELAPTLSRNYEVYLPNVAAMRESLPVSFDTAETNVTKLGAWWGRKLVRLPAMVKVRSPSAGTAILDVEAYDDGWDWTPAVTNAAFAVTGGVVRLETVYGTNLHGVTEVTVAYVMADGTTNAVTSTAVRNPLYGKVAPEIAGVARSALADGAHVTVTVSGETGTCSFEATFTGISTQRSQR